MKIFGLNISRAPEKKESSTWSGILAFLSGQPVVNTPINYGTLVQAGYQINATAHACVSLIARSAGRISWYVQRVDPDGDAEELEGHPLGALLAKPNEYTSGPQFIESVISYKLLAGNSYVQRVGVMNNPPKFLYALRPDRMEIKPGDTKALVGGYVYKVNGKEITLKTEEVLHLREFHPLHDFYGLSKLEVAAKSIDTSNWSSEWNLKLLQNDMRPPGILDIKGSLSEEQRTKLAEQLKSKYQGGSNAGTPLIVESGQGMEWKQTSIAPKDMDWLNAEKFNMRRICAIFGVASELLGDSENKTYSNIQEARRALYMEAVLPAMDEIRDSFNSWLSPLYGDGISLAYDRDKIEALQEDRAQKYAYLTSAKHLTINEKREASGYDDYGPAGDVILVSMGELPLDQAVAEPEPLPSTGTGEEGEAGTKSAAAAGAKAKWSAPERKRALWDNFVLRIKARERGIVGTAKVFLEAQAERAAKGRGLDVRSESKAFAKAIRSWAYDTATRAGAAGMRASKGELPEVEEKVSLFNLTLSERKLLDDMILRSGTQIAETTMEKVRDILKYAEGVDLTTEELTQLLISDLKDLANTRCRTIARTESAKVENWGQLEGYKKTEYVTRKGWMCSFVEDSRDAHMEADGQEVGIDEDFKVGGKAMAYPGDPAGDAGNVVNCLCNTYPIVD